MGAIFSARNYSRKISGVGSPEGVRSAGLGTYYEDTVTGDEYVKTSRTGQFGWVVLGGSSGGGGALSIKAVAGEMGGPVAETFVYSRPDLVGKSVDFIVVNNIIELSYGAAAAFTFDPLTGEFTRPGEWFAGDTLLIQYR